MIKSRKFLFFSSLICIVTFFTADIQAAQGGNPGGGLGKGKGHGVGQSQSTKGLGVGNPGKGSSKSVLTHGKSPARVKFSRKSKTIITNYFHATPFPISTLPPGIAMNLARGKPLPPGIQKVFLPSALTSLLPVYPGYEYRVVGDDVVLVNTETEIIADILSNILK